jgi:YcxB-like protein
MICLQFTLSKEDLFQFSYFTGWTAQWNKKKRLTYYVKFILTYVIFLSVALIFWKKNLANYNAIIFFAVILFISLLILPAWIRSSFRRTTESFYSDPKNSTFFLKSELTIDENGINNKDGVSSTNYSWSAIVKKAETPRYFYLYVNSVMAMVIPKTSFTSMAEQKEFEKLLLIHLPLQAELNYS